MTTVKAAWSKEKQQWRPLKINGNEDHKEKLEENIETLNRLS